MSTPTPTGDGVDAPSPAVAARRGDADPAGQRVLRASSRASRPPGGTPWCRRPGVLPAEPPVTVLPGACRPPCRRCRGQRLPALRHRYPSTRRNCVTDRRRNGPGRPLAPPGSGLAAAAASTSSMSWRRPPLAGAAVPGQRRAAFDVEAVRRDFPILGERINGRRLVWLDNAATTQKPQAVIDRLGYFYAHENSNIHRAAHTLAARATDAYEGARSHGRGLPRRAVERDRRLHPGRHRGDQPGRAGLGPPATSAPATRS